MSTGRSTSTGPGRPETAISKAPFSAAGSSSTERTRKLCFTAGRLLPKVSDSWKASVPMRWVATCPEIATRGTESMKAVASPVRMFVNPGPEVQMHTPGFPEARAYPSAAWAAACSCRMRMWAKGAS